ncbi:MAG: hypothetical protein VB089_15285, partial [Anaerolineaceae bacterium]|nr:hypothetical protein [Anaerolineaceae bacterium]
MKKLVGFLLILMSMVITIQSYSTAAGRAPMVMSISSPDQSLLAYTVDQPVLDVYRPQSFWDWRLRFFPAWNERTQQERVFTLTNNFASSIQITDIQVEDAPSGLIQEVNYPQAIAPGGDAPVVMTFSTYGLQPGSYEITCRVKAEMPNLSIDLVVKSMVTLRYNRRTSSGWLTPVVTATPSPPPTGSGSPSPSPPHAAS